MLILAREYRWIGKPFSRLGMEISKIACAGIGLSISWKLLESVGDKLDFSSRASSKYVLESLPFQQKDPLFAEHVGEQAVS